ncbi:MAG: hypothetical protein ACTSX6_00475 [Candidatus Heimdallarchaeaceae archaeon]
MKDRSVLYLKTKIGSYALTEPIVSPEYPEPKRFLIRLSPKKEAEHRDELIEARVSCAKTKTGAKFCVFEWDSKLLEGMETAVPSCKYSKMVKEGLSEKEAIEKCLKEGKQAFLIVKEKL